MTETMSTRREAAEQLLFVCEIEAARRYREHVAKGLLDIDQRPVPGWSNYKFDNNNRLWICVRCSGDGAFSYHLIKGDSDVLLSQIQALHFFEASINFDPVPGLDELAGVLA